MPTIVLSDTYDAKLKRLAEPFVDTRESIIQRLIDEAVAKAETMSNRNGHAHPVVKNMRQLHPDAPGDLTHTRVLSATIDGQQLHHPKWKGVMDHLHVIGLQHLGSFEALKQASGANLRKGRFEKDGYKYLPQADLSIQGVAAKLAWSHSLHLARTLKVPVRLEIQWHDKPEAAHPGETAVLEWTPTK
jgi:hypothetical protein